MADYREPPDGISFRLCDVCHCAFDINEGRGGFACHSSGCPVHKCEDCATEAESDFCYCNQHLHEGIKAEREVAKRERDEIRAFYKKQNALTALGVALGAKDVAA